MKANLHYTQLLSSQTFTAIDFETANRNRNSACSVGYVRVVNGEIEAEGHSLIKPKDARVDDSNYRIHGISEQDLATAPNFEAVWPILEPLLSNQVVVAHNCSFDIDVLKAMAQDYEIMLPEFRYMCSQKLAQEAFLDLKNYRLADVAAHLTIQLSHHNSLSDARACALVTVKALSSSYDFKFKHNDPELTRHISKKRSETVEDRSLSGLHAKKKVDSDLLKPNLDAENKGHLFYNKRVVFTGDLKSLSRQQAAEKMQAIGADINTAISKKTNFVIVGEKAGPSKIKKIADLQASGCSIQVINEPEFLGLL